MIKIKDFTLASKIGGGRHFPPFLHTPANAPTGPPQDKIARINSEQVGVKLLACEPDSSSHNLRSHRL